MRATQFKLLALTLGVQLILISSLFLLDRLPETAPMHVISMTCSIASFLVPYAGYIFALYGAPMISRVPRVLKMLAPGLISVALTAAGHLFALVLFMSAGVPLRHD